MIAWPSSVFSVHSVVKLSLTTEYTERPGIVIASSHSSYARQPLF